MPPPDPMNLSRLWLVVAAVVLGTVLVVDAYVEHMQPRPVLAASLPHEPAFTGHLEAVWTPGATHMRRGCRGDGAHSGHGAFPGHHDRWANGPGSNCGTEGRRPASAHHLPYPGLELLGVKEVCESSDPDAPMPPKFPAGSGFVQ